MLLNLFHQASSQARSYVAPHRQPPQSAADAFTRRQFLRCVAALSALPLSDAFSARAAGAPKLALPAGVPAGVAALIATTLGREPSSLNTDWFGTMLMHGLLLWIRQGVPHAGPFARAWFEHHWRAGAVSHYSGPSSRTVVAGGVSITTYAGHYGLAFPCFELARQFGDARARQVCVDIAKIILHQASRNSLGMVGHDDQARFAIPDTCYFVAPPLMMASVLERKNRAVFREQALYQLRTYIDVFLAKDRGLAKTILLENGIGKTCWTRATGWLLWAITGVLRYLPRSAPQFAGFRQDLQRLAEGIARVQDASGGLRVLLDEPATPLETTGTAMCATALHESVRRGWLGDSFTGIASRAWDFVQANLTPEGDVRRAYTGWAVPAENRVMSMDEHRMDWIPGLILNAAHEFTVGSVKAL